MIIEYHRPNSLTDALALLDRNQPVTVPLGGGTFLNRPSSQHIAVVDLQALGLGRIERQGNMVRLGATATLQSLVDSTELPLALIGAAEQELPFNLRQVATVAGTLVASDGMSPLTCAMLALDVQLKTLFPARPDQPEFISLGDFLPVRSIQHRFILEAAFYSQVRLTYEKISRTPADKPILCLCAARWPSGRTRITVGGFGASALLAMDGPESSGAEMAVRNVLSQAGDEWATAAYRQETGAELVNRALTHLSES